MWLLLLDPLVLLLLLAMLVYAVVVWRGAFRRWFGRPERWTVLAWPLPLAVLLTPLVAGAGMALLSRAGAGIGEGGVLDAVVYATLYLVPVTVMTLFPPRWLLPPWARQHLVVPPSVPPDAEVGAVGAVRTAKAGHGSLARWVWRIDAVPGTVWVADGHVRFRRADRDTEPPVPTVAADHEDDAEVGALELGEDGELWLAPPRGGWRTSRHLDVDLRDVDRWTLHATRPWRHDGLLTLEVEGRSPVRLWLADVRELRRQLPPGRGLRGRTS
jgi:hypothetical protein